MKKFSLLILAMLFYVLGGIAQDLNGYNVTALDTLKTKNIFQLDTAKFNLTTQVDADDTTLVSLQYLKDVYDPISYCPVDMTVTYGTLTQGVAGDLCVVGGTDVIIGEAVNPSMEIDFEFTGVTKLSGVTIYGQYDGGASHEVHVLAYNYTTAMWDYLGEISYSDDKLWHAYSLYTPNNYLDAGTVLIKIQHQGTGINSHDLILDYLDVNFGGGGGTGFIGASAVTFTPYAALTTVNVQAAIQQFYDLWISKDTSFVNELDSFYSQYQSKWLMSGDTIYDGGGTEIDSANAIYEDVLAAGEVIIDIGFAANPNSIVFINGDVINPGRWYAGSGTTLHLDLPIYQYDELIVLQNGISSNYLFEDFLAGTETEINLSFELSANSTVFINGDLLMTTEWSGIGTSALALNFPIGENDVLVVKN